VEFSLGKSKKKKNYSNYYALRGVNKRWKENRPFREDILYIMKKHPPWY
jgi:hypothetical protein